MDGRVNKLHLYMGDGKGKTTSAMGLALRALGRGHSAIVAQFLKSGTSGEVQALRGMPGCEVFDMPAPGKFSFQMGSDERQAFMERTAERVDGLTAHVFSVRPELVVLDELALCVHLGMVSDHQAKALIEAALVCGEVVVTGRYAPDWLTDLADYVSEVVKRRHPYDLGLPAREGVEY